jgi:hypothetical protein
VLDNTYATVYVFSFDREYLGELNSFRGDLVSPIAMGVRPGLYAPLSSVLPPIEDPIAGRTASAPIYLRDSNDESVSATHPTDAEALGLKVQATGFIPGTDFATTIDGEIVVNEDAVTYASMSASVTIPYAGTWSLAGTHGLCDSEGWGGWWVCR